MPPFTLIQSNDVPRGEIHFVDGPALLGVITAIGDGEWSESETCDCADPIPMRTYFEPRCARFRRPSTVEHEERVEARNHAHEMAWAVAEMVNGEDRRAANRFMRRLLPPERLERDFDIAGKVLDVLERDEARRRE